MKAFFKILVQSYQEWKEDKAPKQAAALAYYSIFSLAPLVTIIITLLGWFYKENDISTAFMNQVTGLIGDSGKLIFETIAEAANKPQTSILAAIISTVTMLFGATGIFVQLKDALNTAWDIEENKKNPEGLKGLLKVRAIAIASVIVIFFLLLISLFASSVISSIMGRFSSDILIISILIQLLNQVMSIGMITLLFAFIFKYLPDTKVAWKDVWTGALFTSVLFNIGKYVIGIYLGNSNVGSAFGAAGSVLVVLVWVYYSALLILFGAEFTQVYSQLDEPETVGEDGTAKADKSDDDAKGRPKARTRKKSPNEKGKNEKGDSKQKISDGAKHASVESAVDRKLRREKRRAKRLQS